MQTLKHSDFISLCAKASVPISTETIKSFANGTGYMDKGVHIDLGLNCSENGSGIDEHGRQVLVHGTPLGNVIIFERYLGKTLLAWNATAGLKSLLAYNNSACVNINPGLLGMSGIGFHIGRMFEKRVD